MHVALEGPTGLLETVEVRDVTPAAIKVIQLGRGEVDSLGGTRGVVVGRKRLGTVVTITAQLLLTTGEIVETARSGHCSRCGESGSKSQRRPRCSVEGTT